MPTNLVRLGPMVLRADEDADVIAALERSGNKACLVRACIRLAMAVTTIEPLRPYVSQEEFATIERARGRDNGGNV